jgi:hypothetical protein
VVNPASYGGAAVAPVRQAAGAADRTDTLYDCQAH